MYTKTNLSALLESAYYKNNDLTGKRVLLRSCLNVSIDASGNIQDDTRLKESLPTILDLAGKASLLVIVGHMGRPDGVEVSALSFAPIAEYLQNELSKIGKDIILCRTLDEVRTHNVHGSILLLENIRFNKQEESKEIIDMVQFAASLAECADVFVNDAFADYRPSASTYYIAKVIPSFLGFITK
jgi:phosphoglycerate kinase